MTPVPGELVAAIERAVAKLDGRDDGSLPLVERYGMRRAYGRSRPSDEGPVLPGTRRRYALQRACVLRVMPLWDAARPGDGHVQEMLELADGVLAGTLDRSEAVFTAKEFMDHLSDQYGEGHIRGAPQAAGIAASRLPRLAWIGEVDDPMVSGTPRPVLEDFDDSEIYDSDEMPPESFAVLAAEWADAPADNDMRPDADARRQFWWWYVTEAYPTAYRAA